MAFIQATNHMTGGSLLISAEHIVGIENNGVSTEVTMAAPGHNGGPLTYHVKEGRGEIAGRVETALAFRQR